MQFAVTGNSRGISLCQNGRGKPAAAYATLLRPSGRIIIGDTLIAHAGWPPCRMTGRAASSVGSVSRCCIVFSEAEIPQRDVDIQQFTDL
jgi:hypothetical protein